jgi:hypothetical protein
MRISSYGRHSNAALAHLDDIEKRQNKAGKFLPTVTLMADFY